MTDNEPTHDGWPAEYRDPRDRPHPETLRITTEPFEQAREETLAAARTTEAANPHPQSSRLRASTICEKSSPSGASNSCAC